MTYKNTLYHVFKLCIHISYIASVSGLVSYLLRLNFLLCPIKVSSENFKMCSESCRIENELQEEKSSKEKLQEEIELLKAKLEKLQNKNRRLKDERNDMSRDKVLLEGQLTDKSHEYENILSEMQNANDAMQVCIPQNPRG